MGTICFVTGGVRSGKSSWALNRGNSVKACSHIYIATAEPFDDEMSQRALNHQKERGDSWTTVEESLDPGSVVLGIQESAAIIVDCCTVWLANIWHHFGSADETLDTHVTSFCTALAAWQRQGSGEIILVSNEVGWGIVPPDAGVRQYRDWAGRLNQRIAALADEVYLCVSGISLQIKPGRNT